MGVQSDGFVPWSGKVCTGGVCSLVSRGCNQKVLWLCQENLCRGDVVQSVVVQSDTFVARSGQDCTSEG